VTGCPSEEPWLWRVFGEERKANSEERPFYCFGAGVALPGGGDPDWSPLESSCPS
jgi:hypothetical protein